MNRVRLENRNFVDVTWDVDVVAATSDARRASDVVPTTFFAIPKPFKGHTGVIQRNAIKSWCQIAPEIEIILIGDEFGIAEVANEFGLLHIPTVDRNEHGTPLVNSAFAAARAASNSPVLVYCNCDVILLKDFSAAIDQLMKSELKQFLAFGRRTDLQVESEIDFESAETEFRLGARVAKEGRSSSIVCKEYFVFTRDLCASVPGFAVGRGNWDNWIVANARALGVPTVNLSEVVSAIHQQHGYSETSQKNRLKDKPMNIFLRTLAAN